MTVERADYVVVGAGLAGISAALKLAERSDHVVLLDFERDTDALIDLPFVDATRLAPSSSGVEFERTVRRMLEQAGVEPCATSSRSNGLSLLRRAIDAGTVRVLIANLTPEDASAVDSERVCAMSPEAQDMWLDALRLLGFDEALRSYNRCGVGVNLDAIDATKLPLTPARREWIDRYIKQWTESPALPDTIVGSTAASADHATVEVQMALEADGTPDALLLCERLAAKIGSRCRAQLLTGPRMFDTPESAIANDPFLTLYKPKLVATRWDGQRRAYLLETLKRPHDDTCRPVAVLGSESGWWSLKRVECETGSGLAEDL